MTTWHDVMDFDQIEDDEPAGAVIDGIQIVLCREGDEVFALQDLCTHETALLSQGFVEDGCIECPLHQGMFDIRTGAAVKEPCTVPVKSFAARVVQGRVEVSLDASHSSA